MSQLTEDIVTYYSNLLISQYNGKPKAIGHIKALVRAAIADQIFTKVRDAYDLATAQGPQLDAIATYRGARRKSPGLDLGRVYFAWPTYSDLSPETFYGFARYIDAAPTWYFRSYPDDSNPSYTLTDDELRRLVMYLARLHSSNHSLADIDDFCFEFFGVYVTVTDNLNMTMTIHHDLTDPDTLFAIVHFLGVLPRPAGVQLTVTES